MLGNDTLPAILTRDQGVRFLKAVPDLEMRTLFITIYSGGLRVSEEVALTARDIDIAETSILCDVSEMAVLSFPGIPGKRHGSLMVVYVKIAPHSSAASFTSSATSGRI